MIAQTRCGELLTGKKLTKKFWSCVVLKRIGEFCYYFFSPGTAMCFALTAVEFLINSYLNIDNISLTILPGKPLLFLCTIS